MAAGGIKLLGYAEKFRWTRQASAPDRKAVGIGKRTGFPPVSGGPPELAYGAPARMATVWLVGKRAKFPVFACP